MVLAADPVPEYSLLTTTRRFWYPIPAAVTRSRLAAFRAMCRDSGSVIPTEKMRKLDGKLSLPSAGEFEFLDGLQLLEIRGV